MRRGVSLGQLATAAKSNEITAIPELIDQIDVSNAVVTIDAAGCQREIAAKIIDGGGDYDLALKGNQETLHRQVQDHVVAHMENDFADVAARKHEEVIKGHGRVDTLTYYQMPVPDTLTTAKKRKGLKSIGIAIRVSVQGGKETSDVRYYISSTKVGDRRAADNVAWLKRFAISLLKQQTDKESIAMRRRMAGWNTAYLAKLLGLSRS